MKSSALSKIGFIFFGLVILLLTTCEVAYYFLDQSLLEDSKERAAQITGRDLSLESKIIEKLLEFRESGDGEGIINLSALTPRAIRKICNAYGRNVSGFKELTGETVPFFFDGMDVGIIWWIFYNEGPPSQVLIASCDNNLVGAFGRPQQICSSSSIIVVKRSENTEYGEQILYAFREAL